MKNFHKSGLLAAGLLLAVLLILGAAQSGAALGADNTTLDAETCETVLAASYPGSCVFMPVIVRQLPTPTPTPNPYP